MEKNNTDKLLKNFFSEHKQEIKDNGFTRRVMHRLPEQHDHSWIVWFCACVGMILSLWLGFSSGSIQAGLSHLLQMPIYYFIAAVFCFPLLSTVGFLVAAKRYF